MGCRCTRLLPIRKKSLNLLCSSILQNTCYSRSHADKLKVHLSFCAANSTQFSKIIKKKNHEAGKRAWFFPAKLLRVTLSRAAPHHSRPQPERRGPPPGERNEPELPGPAAASAAETPRRRAKLRAALAPRRTADFVPRYADTTADSLAALPQPAPAGTPRPPRVPPLSSGPVTPRGSPRNSKRGQNRRARPRLARGRGPGGRLQLTDPPYLRPPAAPYLPLSAALLLCPRGWLSPGRRFLRGPFRQRRRASCLASGLGGERRTSPRPAAIFA